MFVNRISELVKHTLQQLASLHSPQAYVVACVYNQYLVLYDYLNPAPRAIISRTA